MWEEAPELARRDCLIGTRPAPLIIWNLPP